MGIINQLGGRKFVAFLVVVVGIFVHADVETLLAAAALYVGSNVAADFAARKSQ